MYYELGKKRPMECERYQDCSWFQQEIMKGSINSKLSQAELPEPIFDPNEFNLAMQIANENAIPWGDEYLEVFDHDILLQDSEKSVDKIKNLNTFTDYKNGEDNTYDTCNTNFELRKADSFDSMKIISSTNPSEVIPISYKEKINNSNYSSSILNTTKPEIKKEVELHSPESNNDLMDSDDGDLFVGREEIVQEEITNDLAFETSKRDKFSPEIDSPDIPLSALLPIITPIEPTKKMPNYNIQKEKKIETIQNTPIKSEFVPQVKIEKEKLALNFDLPKDTIEQSMNVNTPDLDFMDLVEYINEEMHTERAKEATPQESKNTNLSVGNQQKVSQASNESFSNSKTENTTTEKSDENSTVDLNQLSETGVSIAERIKTSAKRRTLKKYSVKDIEVSEEDSSDEDFEDEDEDYDFNEDVKARKSVTLRKRSKSSASESSTSSGKKFKEDSSYVDSYRERRDKNNEASRRSRQNRKDRERQMYKTLEEEERRNVKLKAESDVLEKQVTSLRQLLLQVVLKKGSVT